GPCRLRTSEYSGSVRDSWDVRLSCRCHSGSSHVACYRHGNDDAARHGVASDGHRRSSYRYVETFVTATVSNARSGAVRLMMPRHGIGMSSRSATTSAATAAFMVGSRSGANRGE